MATFLQINDQGDYLLYKDAPHAIYKPYPWIEVCGQFLDQIKNDFEVMRIRNGWSFMRNGTWFLVRWLRYRIVMAKFSLFIHTILDHERIRLLYPMSEIESEIMDFRINVMLNAKPFIDFYGHDIARISREIGINTLFATQLTLNPEENRVTARSFAMDIQTAGLLYMSKEKQIKADMSSEDKNIGWASLERGIFCLINNKLIFSPYVFRQQTASSLSSVQVQIPEIKNRRNVAASAKMSDSVKADDIRLTLVHFLSPEIKT